MSSAEDTAIRAADLIEEYGGLQPFVKKVGIGGVLYAIFLEMINAIGAAGGVLLAPWQALGDALSRLVDQTVGGAVEIVVAGIGTSAQSFETGLASLFGPFAFPLAVAVVMLGVYVFMEGAGWISFSPLQFVRNRR